MEKRAQTQPQGRSVAWGELDKPERKRLVRRSQIVRFIDKELGGTVPSGHYGSNVVLALLAVGQRESEVIRFAPWIGSEQLIGLAHRSDLMMPDEITSSWLGNMLELTIEARQMHRLYQLRPAHWTDEQFKEFGRQRDREQRKVRRKRVSTIAEYKSLVKARPTALYDIIPTDTPISVRDLTDRTKSAKEFCDATGKRLRAASRGRVIHRALNDLIARNLVRDSPINLPNGREVRRVVRTATPGHGDKNG